jgi:hypothetical protein
MNRRDRAAESQLAGGGFSPVVSTVFSSVVVVDPSGVVTVFSVVVEASLLHPLRPSVTVPRTTANDKSRFIFLPF